MQDHFPPIPQPTALTRRRFLRLTSLSAAGWMAGCAVNPVTGQQQLMFVSEEEEIQIDQQYSRIQFSSDYGPVQDQALAVRVLAGKVAQQTTLAPRPAYIRHTPRRPERRTHARPPDAAASLSNPISPTPSR